MTAPNIQSHDLTRLQPGDRIEVWDQDHLRRVGTISQTAPHLGVLWILEDTTGTPKLVPAQGYRLRHTPVARTT